jgi:hypothetical protein
MYSLHGYSQGHALSSRLYDVDIEIFVNCSWVDTWGQQYSTHLHANYTEQHTKKEYTEYYTHNNKNA